MGSSTWDARSQLDENLDPAQAAVYREAASELGGRWLVWPDQAWWERPDGMFQRSVYKPASFDDARWEKVDV